MQGVPLLVLTCALLYLGPKLLSFIKALQAIQYALNIRWSPQFAESAAFRNFRYHPGRRILLSPASFLGAFLPKIWGISHGRNNLFDDKHQSQYPKSSYHTSLRAMNSFWVNWLGHLFIGKFQVSIVIDTLEFPRWLYSQMRKQEYYLPMRQP